MSKLNKSALYLSNVRGTFFGGYVPVRDWGDLGVWVGHTAFLPLSLTVGAGLKTLIDIKTRHEIPETTIKNLISNISKMGNETFDNFVNNILTYKPKSRSSKALLDELRDARNHELSEIYDIKAVEEGRLKKGKLNTFLSAHDPKVKNQFSISISPIYQLSKEESDIIEEKIKPSCEKLAIDRRKTQREAIQNYLCADKNAGKKLQHVILDETSPKNGK